MGGLFHKLRHPRRCYVVCAIARSGSNLLTDGLHATRRAGRPKQFFLRKYEAHYAAKSRLEATDFADYVRGIIPATATSNEVFGFKLMGWYLQEFLGRLRETREFGGGEPGDDIEMLRNTFPELQFVQIVRQNKVRQAISKARAAQTGLWKIQEGNSALGEPAFDPELIASCIEDALREEMIWTRFFQRIGVEPFRVEYEDLTNEYADTIAGLLRFLQIPPPRRASLRPTTVRQTDALSREWEERFLSLRSPNELLIF
ncbi:MAG TPA: Stf0 family sulfotransferase [Chthoniobacterales bacterium]|nr:Stf0 family sulfotransferase [Chthoniobacterales bacterium]